MFLLMALLIFTGLVIGAYPTQNLINNGTFTTDTDHWIILNSENMTVGSDSGHCSFNTTHTDFITLRNYTDFINGTTFDTTVLNGTPSGELELGNGYFEISSTTTNIINNSYFNESLGNWTYSEFGNSSASIRGLYNSTNISEPTGYSIQTHKLTNETEVDEPCVTDPAGSVQGNGNINYTWNNTGGVIDCSWVSAQTSPAQSNFARQYWEITERNQMNNFGASFGLKRNQSGVHDGLSSVVFGFMNTNNLTQGANSILFELYIGTTEASVTAYCHIFCTNGTKVITNGSGLSNLNVSILNQGVDIVLSYESGVAEMTIYNKTGISKAWFRQYLGWGEFDINCVGIANQDWTARNPARTWDGYISNITSWYGSANISTTARAQIETTNLITNYSRVHVETYRKHYHSPQMGEIRSSMEVIYGNTKIVNETVYGPAAGNGTEWGPIYLDYGHVANCSLYLDLAGEEWILLTENGDYILDYVTGTVNTTLIGQAYDENWTFYAYYNTTSVMELVYNSTSTNTTDWVKEELDFYAYPGGVTTKLWTTQTLTEGSETWYAKSANWDNCFVNTTVYNLNGTYVSEVLDRGYLSDWLHMTVSHRLYYDTNLTISTRTGNVAIVDGTWSSWTNLSDISNTTFGSHGNLSGIIESPNGRYVQFKVEIAANNSWISSQVYLVELASVKVQLAREWGIIEQDFTKPYTNETELKYKYKINYLNNTQNGNITVMINNYTVAQHNFTYFTTNWISKEYLLSTINASDAFTLNITTDVTFNSTNGSATVFIDDVELNIVKQAPTITSFNAINDTSISFNGVFTDYTRGANYDFLGTDGIESINISIGVFDLEVTNITHMGNGTFEFYHVWANPPITIVNDTILNATVTVIDTTGLYDTDITSLVLPTATQFMIALMTMGFVVIVIVLIFERHLMLDTLHDYLPELITKGRSK